MQVSNAMTKSAVLLLSTILIGSTAFSEGAGGHGGDAVKTPNGYRFLDLVRNTDKIIDVEAEGYRDELSDILAANPGFAMATFYPSSFEETTQPAAKKTLSAMLSLRFYRHDGPIPEVGDRGTVVLPWSYRGKIVRLAIQDQSTKKVLIDQEIFDALPRRDQVAMFMHESLIRMYLEDLAWNPPLESTEKIAALVNATFNNRSRSGLGARSVSNYMCDAGLMVNEKSNFGLRKVKGLGLMETQLPEKTVAFSKTDDQCLSFSLVAENGGRAVISDGVNEIRRVGYWKFGTPDSEGVLHSFFITLSERRDSGIETDVESHLPDSPLSIADGDFTTIQRKYHFSVWQ